MTYARLREHRGLQWPCPDADRLEPPYLHGRLWEKDPVRRGRRAPFGIVQHDPPAERVDERYPIRLGIAGRPDSCGDFNSRPGHGIELSPEDAERYEVVAGEEVRVSSRHASVLASVRIDTALRPGLAFMTPRSPEEVDVDRAAVRIEKTTSPSSGTSGARCGTPRCAVSGRTRGMPWSPPWTTWGCTDERGAAGSPCGPWAPRGVWRHTAEPYR